MNSACEIDKLIYFGRRRRQVELAERSMHSVNVITASTDVQILHVKHA